MRKRGIYAALLLIAGLTGAVLLAGCNSAQTAEGPKVLTKKFPGKGGGAQGATRPPEKP